VHTGHDASHVAGQEPAFKKLPATSPAHTHEQDTCGYIDSRPRCGRN
jgi:hypothetical protein